MSMTDDEILAEGCRVFNLERQALEKVENDLGAPFVAAVRLILQTKGNVIFSGVGKSGHIGRKLAATFSSTGTTSFFVHRPRRSRHDPARRRLRGHLVFRRVQRIDDLCPGSQGDGHSNHRHDRKAA